MKTRQQNTPVRRIAERVNAVWLRVLDFGAPAAALQPVPVRSAVARNRFVTLP